jgi:signal transduction histidine kinase
VTLALQLGAAQATLGSDPDNVASKLDRVVDGLNAALNELRETARGIHPASLTRGGLGSALRSLARRSPMPVEVDVRTTSRLPEPVEVAVYYVVWRR